MDSKDDDAELHDEGSAEVEERYRHLWNLVFGHVAYADSQENIKSRLLRPEIPLDPMCYVPVSPDDPIPREVIDERLSLLGESDRAAVTKEIDSGRDPLGVFLYFGGKTFPTDEENVSAAMTRICAYVGRDVETTLRLFTASVWASSAFTTEELYAMAEETVDFVNAFRDTMAKINRTTFGYNKKIGLSRYGTKKRRW